MHSANNKQITQQLTIKSDMKALAVRDFETVYKRGYRSPGGDLLSSINKTFRNEKILSDEYLKLTYKYYD